MNLIDYFENTVHSFPGKAAISDSNSELNFKALKQSAKQLATHISKNQHTVNQPSAIFYLKSMRLEYLTIKKKHI